MDHGVKFDLLACLIYNKSIDIGKIIHDLRHIFIGAQKCFVFYLKYQQLVKMYMRALLVVCQQIDVNELIVSYCTERYNIKA